MTRILDEPIVITKILVIKKLMSDNEIVKYVDVSYANNNLPFGRNNLIVSFYSSESSLVKYNVFPFYTKKVDDSIYCLGIDLWTPMQEIKLVLVKTEDFLNTSIAELLYD